MAIIDVTEIYDEILKHWVDCIVKKFPDITETAYINSKIKNNDNYGIWISFKCFHENMSQLSIEITNCALYEYNHLTEKDKNEKDEKLSKEVVAMFRTFYNNHKDDQQCLTNVESFKVTSDYFK